MVVASRAGDDVHPSWFLNLRDDPRVEVRVVGQPRQAMRARVATGEERARMWPLIAGRYRNYAGLSAAHRPGDAAGCCCSVDRHLILGSAVTWHEFAGKAPTR